MVVIIISVQSLFKKLKEKRKKKTVMGQSKSILCEKEVITGKTNVIVGVKKKRNMESS